MTVGHGHPWCCSPQEPGLFTDYGSPEQRQRFAQRWHKEEQERAAAFDRLPPDPRAVPLAGDKLTERLLRLVHVCSQNMAQPLTP